MDMVTREHMLGHFSMFFCNAVDVFAQIERQECHVEAVLASKVLEHVERDDLAEHLLDKGIGELVVPSFHRRVRGEYAKIPHPRHVPERPFIPDPLDVALEPEKQFKHKKACMPFV